MTERKTTPVQAGIEVRYKDASKPQPGITTGAKLAKEDLTPDELEALQAIDDAVAHGPPSADVEQVPQRTLDHGLIQKNDNGGLELTAVGKRMLRPS